MSSYSIIVCHTGAWEKRFLLLYFLSTFLGVFFFQTFSGHFCNYSISADFFFLNNEACFLELYFQSGSGTGREPEREHFAFSKVRGIQMGQISRFDLFSITDRPRMVENVEQLKCAEAAGTERHWEMEKRRNEDEDWGSVKRKRKKILTRVWFQLNCRIRQRKTEIGFFLFSLLIERGRYWGSPLSVRSGRSGQRAENVLEVQLAISRGRVGRVIGF